VPTATVQVELFMADFELLRDDVDQILNSGADRLFAAY
jgi:hypothetical protein